MPWWGWLLALVWIRCWIRSWVQDLEPNEDET